MTDLKECKIIDTIDIRKSKITIQTPCGKFLIGIEYNSIYKYCLETKQKFRIAGVDQPGYQDGTRDESRFNNPKGLTLSKDLKTLFVSGSYNCVIRAICVDTGVTTTFTGQVDVQQFVDGPKEKACFDRPQTLKLSPDGNTLYVGDDSKLRTICITTGQVDTIDTFEYQLWDFALSPDGKHIIICYLNQVLKYNFETSKSKVILQDLGCMGCDLSKDGQILFISNVTDQTIKVVNLVTNEVMNTITTTFRPAKLTISTNGKQLFVCCYLNRKIKVLDISEYCTNFKTLTQLQFSKHSFLPRLVVKRISI
jgi:DNA-binding beta-propeller fold protein YncE